MLNTTTLNIRDARTKPGTPAVTETGIFRLHEETRARLRVGQLRALGFAVKLEKRSLKADRVEIPVWVLVARQGRSMRQVAAAGQATVRQGSR